MEILCRVKLRMSFTGQKKRAVKILVLFTVQRRPQNVVVVSYFREHWTNSENMPLLAQDFECFLCVCHLTTVNCNKSRVLSTTTI